MTRRPGKWAEKKVAKHIVAEGGELAYVYAQQAAALLTQEHARALRVVNGKMEELLGVASGLPVGGITRDKIDAQIALLHDIRAALQKGRP